MSDCQQCKHHAADAIAYGNTCCGCGELLIQGGYWAWHVEGFRIGPFCNDCTDKPTVQEPLDDPSMSSFPTRLVSEKRAETHEEFIQQQRDSGVYDPNAVIGGPKTSPNCNDGEK